MWPQNGENEKEITVCTPESIVWSTWKSKSSFNSFELSSFAWICLTLGNTVCLGFVSHLSQMLFLRVGDGRNTARHKERDKEREMKVNWLSNCVVNTMMYEEKFLLRMMWLHGMAVTERHRVLRRFVVQDLGASDKVSHENNVTHQYYIVYLA